MIYIDDVAYKNHEAVVDAFGCRDYSDNDWRAIAMFTLNELVDMEQRRMHGLSEPGRLKLAMVMREYAKHRVAEVGWK